jgi:sensor histidine kinase YesM
MPMAGLIHTYNTIFMGVIPTFFIYLLFFLFLLWGAMEIIIWRFGMLRKKKKEMLEVQIQYAQLEDRALRAQMNPHFIFNSLNSIKLLVQENQNPEAIVYLSTFTRLLRNILENAEKNTTRLFDEIETCKLYLQLENLRFNNEINWQFSIDPTIDLKSIEVPTLVLQPFLENAIWHGLMPKSEDRKLQLVVKMEDGYVICLVDDNGIGREAAQKSANLNGNHKSKGLQMTKERIQLMDKLHDTNSHLTIRDKFSAEGMPLGTQVELKFIMNEPTI